MGWNYLTIKYLDGIGLNLYGKQLDFRIMYALGENVAQKRPIFYRTDDNERPYISATPTRSKIGGSTVWDDWETYNCVGVNVYMKCPESDYYEDREYVFALCSTNSDVSYRVYKANDYSTTMGQFEYNSDEGLAPLLLTKNNDGSIYVIVPNEFGRYETNTVSVPSTAFRNNGEVNYTFDTDFNIQTVFGSPTNFVYEGCAPRFETNCKVFDTEEHARAYLETGATDGLLEEEEEEPDIPTEYKTKTYKYDVQKFTYSDVAMNKPTGNVEHSVLTVTFTDYPTNEYDSTTHFEPIVAIVDNDDYDSGVQFVIHNGFGEYITECSITVNGTPVTVNNPVTAIEGLSTFGYGMGFDTTGSAYIKNMVHTNITILGVGGTALPPTNILGGDVMTTNSNNAHYDVGLSECWFLHSSDVRKLAKCFNTTVNKLEDNSGGYIVADWLLGLACYNNPLDVISDFFYLPVDISDYVEKEDGSFNFAPSLEALYEED